MLQIVEKACQFYPDMSRGVVTIESDCQGPEFNSAFDELNSIDCRNLALQYATQRGMSGASINGSNVGPYPINGNGETLDKVADASGQPLPAQHPRMQVARYRCDVPVARKF